MYKQLTFIVFLFILSVPSLAFNQQQVNATQDVTAHSNGLPHGNDTQLMFSKGDTFVQFNITNLTSYLWEGIYPAFYKTESFCSTSNNCFRWVYYVQNNTWSQNTLNTTNKPNLTNSIFATVWSHGVSTGNYAVAHEFFSLTNPHLSPPFKTGENRSNWLTEMYQQDLVTFYISTGFSSPGATSGGTNGSVSSKEGGNPPYLLFNITTYLNGTVTNTDLNGFIEFDFEGPFKNTTTFPSADFLYISSTNSLIPNNALNTTIAIADVSTGQDNDIDTRIERCTSISSYVYTQQFPNPYPGQYNYYCFNLSSTHGGKPFYGMIKVINNSNVRGNSSIDFDYYYAVMSPLHLIFTPPTISPNPAQVGLNLSVQTRTNSPIGNTIMYFYYNASGNISTVQGLNDINGDGNRVVHNFIINGQAVLPAVYSVYFTGIDLTNNTVVTSATYTFNVSLPFNAQVNNSILPTAIDRLVSGGIVATHQDGLWLFGGLVLVMGTLFAYIFAGGIKVAIITAVSLIAILGLMGFLPYFIIVPVIVIVVILIGKGVLGIFHGGGYN